MRIRLISPFAATAVLLLLVLFLPNFAALGVHPPESAAAVAQRPDPEEELEKAQELLRRRNYEEALKGFKKANELMGKRCGECLLGMAQSYNGMGAHKNAMESCEQLIALAAADKDLQARARNLKGVSLTGLVEKHKKDDKRLVEAEAEFRKVLELTDDLTVAYFNLGTVLLRQERDAEGIAQLKLYLEEEPRGPFARDAARMIENPRRARETYAPDFSLTTVQGEYFSAEDLKGKVVLLDFWGTWCPPCVDSVPSLRNLHKRHSKDSNFVMIAVSSDTDEDVWRAFIEKHKMVWPQHLDAQRRVIRAFQINAYPTYILIDHEGIVRYRSTGGGWVKSAFIEDEIKKRLKELARSAE